MSGKKGLLALSDTLYQLVGVLFNQLRGLGFNHPGGLGVVASGKVLTAICLSLHRCITGYQVLASLPTAKQTAGSQLFL